MLVEIDDSGDIYVNKSTSYAQAFFGFNVVNDFS